MIWICRDKLLNFKSLIILIE